MKKIVSVLIFLMWFDFAFSQSFGKRFSAYGVSSIDTTYDNGYVFAVNDTLNSDFFKRYLITTDSLGNVTNALGNDSMRVNSISQTADRGYIVFGAKTGYEFMPDTIKVIIIKTDSLFNIQWQFGIMNDSIWPNYVLNNHDSTISVISENAIYKFNLAGNLLSSFKFNKSFGGIITTHDGGFVFATPSDSSIVKADGNGNIIWSKKILHSDIRYFAEAYDGGYIINEGWVRQIPPIGVDITHKLDSQGQPVWAQEYFCSPFDPACGNILPLTDGTYIKFSIHSDAVATLMSIHIDSIGNVLSASDINMQYFYSYNYDLTQRKNGIAYINSSTVACFAYQDNFDSAQCNIPVIVNTSPIQDTTVNTLISVLPAPGLNTFQTNYIFYPVSATTYDLCTSVNIPVINENRYTISPNPMHNFFYINTNHTEQILITIYDFTGRVMMSKTIGSNESLINIDFAAGVYLLSVKSDSYTSIRKIIVQ